MKYTCNPYKPTNNHYNATLLFDNCAQLCQQDKDNFESPSPTSLQLIMLDDADEVIDLTGDSETTFMQCPVYLANNNNNNELQFPTNVSMNIVPEWVEDLPQNIDGMKIYKIKCLPRELIHKAGTRGTSRCILQKGKT